VIELTFAEEDIDVVAVSDGDQAIARLDTMPPDIVLVDVGMPGRSGYDVASHVKHTPHLSHIPVVLLTGAFEPVDEVKANAVGCDGILAKPFEPQMIISRVKELLARPESEQEIEKGSEKAGEAAVGLAMFAPEMADAAPASPAAPAIPVAALPASPEPPAASESPAASEIPAAPAANPEVTARLDEYFDQLESAFARLTKAQPPMPAEAVASAAAEAAPAELDWFGPPRGAEPAAFDASLALHPTPSPSGLSFPDSAELFGDIHAAAPPVTVDRAVPVAAANPVATLEPVAVLTPAAAPNPMAAVATAVPDLMLAPEPVVAPAQVPEPVAYTQVTASEEPAAQRAIAAGEPLAVAPTAPRDLPPLGDAFAAILAAETADPALPSTRSAPAPTPAAPVITDDVIDRVSRRVIEQLTDRVVREAVAEAVSGIAERLVREEIERIKTSIKD